jgi:hypothetical protein
MREELKSDWHNFNFVRRWGSALTEEFEGDHFCEDSEYSKLFSSQFDSSRIEGLERSRRRDFVL